MALHLTAQIEKDLPQAAKMYPGRSQDSAKLQGQQSKEGIGLCGVARNNSSLPLLLPYYYQLSIRFNLVVGSLLSPLDLCNTPTIKYCEETRPQNQLYARMKQLHSSRSLHYSAHHHPLRCGRSPSTTLKLWSLSWI